MQFSFVKLGDAFVHLIAVLHCNEAKTSRSRHFGILYDLGAHHLAVLREYSLQFKSLSVLRETADPNIARAVHLTLLGDCSGCEVRQFRQTLLL